MRTPQIATLVALASCGETEPLPDAQAVETFVEVMLNHGTFVVDGDSGWRGSVGGFAGTERSERNGPRPELHECRLWRFTTDFSTLLGDRVTISVPEVGQWELVQFQNGEYGLDGQELPEAPFLDFESRLEAQFRDFSVETSAPPKPVIEAPAPGAVINLPGPVLVQWSQQNEPSIEITLAMFTTGGAFRGAQTCLVPDTGFFMLPRIDEPIEGDIGAAILHLRYIRSAEVARDSLQLTLDVRQFDIRDYEAQLQ
jgi:hypothetical protein